MSNDEDAQTSLTSNDSNNSLIDPEMTASNAAATELVGNPIDELHRLAFDAERRQMIARQACIIQFGACIVCMGLFFMRRSVMVVILNPFFMGASVIGWKGAHQARYMYVFTHFALCIGISLIFLLFLVIQVTWISKDKSDLLLLVLLAPIFIDLAAGIVSYWLLSALYDLKKFREQYPQFRLDESRTNSAGSSRSGGRSSGLRIVSPAPAPQRQEVPQQSTEEITGIRSQDIDRVEKNPAVDIPSAYICVISQSIMRDPVITADGHTYDRQSIQKWFDDGHRTSPLTAAVLNHQSLTPNFALRDAISDFLKKS